MIVVSACLAGCRCRYDGEQKTDPRIRRLIAEGRALPLCPEQLGGLPTPRSPAEIQGGAGAEVLLGEAKVLTKDGQDVTEHYLKGAYETLRMCRIAGASRAVLKSNSPSCGCGAVYDGTFCNKTRPGDGVTAALLQKNGIAVQSEEDYDEG